MERADVVVVGAGIVGLSAARALVETRPHLKVVVLEKEPRPALHQSGRNSGVLHSGIYYAPGSLKAELCVRGRAEMVEFCRTQGVPFEVCGKVIVATAEDEVAGLRALHARGRENGVESELVGPERLRELEPHASGLAALHVPATGIVDYPAVCARLVAQLSERGCEVRCATTVRSVDERADEVVVETSAGAVHGRWVVACAGLHSDTLARASDVRIVPFRGEFYEVVPGRAHLVRNLIYPVPDARFPFLGVHLTRSIQGPVHVGPNAVLALAREGYGWGEVEPRALAAWLAWPGVRRLVAHHWRAGLGELWRSLNKRAFTAAVQRLVPEIRAVDLVPAPAGVRAQAVGSDGKLLDDFSFAESARAVHVVNAPSPAATAALPIGRLIAERLARRF
jgi:L-2-hydroxyglutarate oxidase